MKIPFQTPRALLICAAISGFAPLAHAKPALPPGAQEAAQNSNPGVAAKKLPTQALKLQSVPYLPLNPARANIPIGARVPLANPGRAVVAKELQGLLDDIVDLRLQTKQAHWNLVGPFYLPIHEFLGDAADRYALYADRVAERSLSLGYSVDARPATVVAKSGLAHSPNGFVRDSEAIDLISDRLDTISIRTRKRMEVVSKLDGVTENILQDLIAGFEHDLWQLRVHKQ